MRPHTILWLGKFPELKRPTPAATTTPFTAFSNQATGYWYKSVKTNCCKLFRSRVFQNSKIQKYWKWAVGQAHGCVVLYVGERNLKISWVWTCFRRKLPKPEDYVRPVSH